MFKKLIAIIVVIIIIAAGFWLYHIESSKKTAKAAAPAKPITVDFTQARQENWPVQVDTTGTITSVQGITIRSQTEGPITKILIQSGEVVKKGQPLFQIYPNTLIATLNANIARVKLDKLALKEQTDIYKKGYASLLAMKTATSNYDNSVAQVNRDKAQLALSLVKASVNGKLGLRAVELGDYVKVGDPLIHIQAQGKLRINFSVPEIYLRDIKLGQKVLVQSSSFPNTTFIGDVYAINSALNPDTRSVAIRAYLNNPDNKIISGVFGAVKLNLKDEHPVIVIPQTSVIYDIAGSYVYQVLEGKAVKTNVNTGSHQGGDVAITHGLNVGDTVISSGQVKLHEGALVKNKDQA